MSSSDTAFILDEVDRERERQTKLWGVQNHEPWGWLPILMEEVGEVATELCTFSRTDFSNYETELIQVAAVAVAMVESIRRNK